MLLDDENPTLLDDADDALLQDDDDWLLHDDDWLLAELAVDDELLDALSSWRPRIYRP